MDQGLIHHSFRAGPDLDLEGPQLAHALALNPLDGVARVELELALDGVVEDVVRHLLHRRALLHVPGPPQQRPARLLHSRPGAPPRPPRRAGHGAAMAAAQGLRTSDGGRTPVCT